MSETFTDTRDDLTVTVWMISYNLWAYMSSRGTHFGHGSVEAENRIDAWHKAYDEAELEIFAKERAALYDV